MGSQSLTVMTDLSPTLFSHVHTHACTHTHTRTHTALGLAVARDGSSGGVLRLAIIEESGVTRSVFTGPEIPQFYLD